MWDRKVIDVSVIIYNKEQCFWRKIVISVRNLQFSQIFASR